MAKSKKVKSASDVPELSKLFPFGNDLTHPKHPLNRTKDMSKAEIEAKRDELIERDKARSTRQHRILTGGETPRPPLTEADKKAIAELESGQAQRKEIATANRIAKLKAKKSGATTTLPLTGKAALSAIAQTATEQFVANGGKIKHSDDKPKVKQETQMSKSSKKTAKPVAKSAPKKKGTDPRSAKRASMIDIVVAAMQKNGGVSNAQQLELLKGKRLNIGVLRDACKARGLKFSEGVNKDGLKTYRASK